MATKIKIARDLTAEAMMSLKPFFEKVASNRADVILDLSNVATLDSSGVGGLVYLFKRLREHGHALKIVNAHEQPLALLRHLQLELLLVPDDHNQLKVAS